MKIELKIPFCSLNDYINAERTNRFKAAKIKKQQTGMVTLLTRQAKIKLDQSKCYDVIFIWHKPNNRQDHDNIAFAKKFILDGFVAAKLISNDGPKQVWGLTDKFILDKSQKFTWCEVELIEFDLDNGNNN